MAEETTTEAHVAEEAAAAATAEQLAQTLEQRIVQGDDTITAEQLEAQKSAARFAVLRLQGVREKLKQAKAARRTEAAVAIAAEVETYASGIGQRLAKALQAITAAEDAFVKIADEHDSLVTDWWRRAQALGIPEETGRPVPPAVDGHVAIGKGATLLQVGRRKLFRVNGVAQLSHFRTHTDRAALIATIAHLDDEAEAPADDLLFFRNTRTGAYFTYSPDRLPQGELMSPDLVPVSRAEALGEEP